MPGEHVVFTNSTCGTPSSSSIDNTLVGDVSKQKGIFFFNLVPSQTGELTFSQLTFLSPPICVAFLWLAIESKGNGKSGGTMPGGAWVEVCRHMPPFSRRVDRRASNTAPGDWKPSSLGAAPRPVRQDSGRPRGCSETAMVPRGAGEDPACDGCDCVRVADLDELRSRRSLAPKGARSSRQPGGATRRAREVAGARHACASGS